MWCSVDRKYLRPNLIPPPNQLVTEGERKGGGFFKYKRTAQGEKEWTKPVFSVKIAGVVTRVTSSFPEEIKR